MWNKKQGGESYSKAVQNLTLVNEVFLFGFGNLHNIGLLVFILLLLVYILTVCENVLIITLVATNQNLQSPMYFFLKHLSMADLLQTASVVPILLSTVINEGVTFPLAGCITQFYLFSDSECFQCLLLSVMSYDRYLAICNPLRYNSIMNHRICVKMILVLLLISSILPLCTVSAIVTLQFCARTTIDHFFCDLSPLLELSCSDTFFVQMEVTVLSVPAIVSPFIIIIVSYVCIVRSILKITSSSGRQKAFSTCSSHLVVVSMFYGTLISIYLVPQRNQLLTISKFLSLFYTVVIPLVNPIIYSLRSKDIKSAVQKTFRQCSIDDLY
ncbi:hypothetical protein GDO86_019503 [Hymenochirus boettgeri]|uniref:G-protein coupled receptors family 1 profile domain-containing protein n=1 Tax=Hymenochirus boettgeri TaxID=247094 RepID=A0A8T2IIX6_9PIPI|nr:hypothetical protein GDO86_019503 [Hymenochirus boettgeri]